MLATFALSSALVVAPRSLRLAARTLAMSAKHDYVLDPFVIRQFDDPDYTGTRMEWDKADFEKRVNDAASAGTPLVDGYAPFCKHLFIPNFTPATVPYLKITPENEGFMRSAYDARTEAELPVLVRWFPKESAPPAPVAKFLDIILYSREQIRKESAAMGTPPEETDAPWGIISVKAQDVDHELPMQPITMMRNALGKEEGGSGVPLQRDAYMASVAFWSKYASIK